MRRLLSSSLVLLALASAVALAAGHENGASATGRITALDASAITVTHGHHSLTCAVNSSSPDTSAFRQGEKVHVTCQGGDLVAIEGGPVRHRSYTRADADWTAGISGTLSALDGSSLTVTDGGRSLTCALATGSPSTSRFTVGDHVEIGCTNGALTTIGSVGETTTTTGGTAPNAGANGPISTLTSSAITVEGLSCTFGPSSPSTGGFAVGDPVRLYCLNGVLFALYHDDPTSTTTEQTTTTTSNVTDADGAVSALSSSSITVGDLTCTIGEDSPSTTDFPVGTPVRMYCLNSVLYRLLLNEPSTTTSGTTTQHTTTEQTTTTSNVTGVDGTVSALSSSSITVGDLTCTIGDDSPSTTDFPVGTPVRMYCLNGALYRLFLNEPSTTTSETTTQQTTTTTSNVTDADGTVSALSSSSITVGDLTCTIGDDSPSTTNFPVGTPVRMYCLNGALYRLYLNEPSTTTSETTTQQTTTEQTTTTSNVTGVDGTVSALSSSSITVGDLTCTIGESSPSTSGFSVGESVALYCESGALYALIHR